MTDDAKRLREIGRWISARLPEEGRRQSQVELELREIAEWYEMLYEDKKRLNWLLAELWRHDQADSIWSLGLDAFPDREAIDAARRKP